MSEDRAQDWPARLQVDPSAFLAPGCTVVGEVALGERASVWFGVVLRGDVAPISVGADSNIQDNSVVHVDMGQPTVVGERVTVGHRAIVHGARVEDDCLIGMGAILLSGSVIGRGSLVAAGSLVREGQVVPPGSLAVGAPAKVLGAVTEPQRDAMGRGWRTYVTLSRSYLARGFGRPLPPPEAARGVSAAPERAAEADWAECLAVLAGTPAALRELEVRHPPARWRVRPAAGRWSAGEVACHLRDLEREVFLPRLESMLGQDRPQLARADTRSWPEARRYAESDPAAALADFVAARVHALARLRGLGPESWARGGVHPRRGPYTVADLTRHWADHDLAHLRQVARALEAAP
jgi:carbonic anhydrase/acetyltransferase-like protein (isoleucine patch superfamily)